jgi:hypothetical protein
MQGKICLYKFPVKAVFLCRMACVMAAVLNGCDIRFSPQHNSYYKVVEFNYVQTMHVGIGTFKKG